MDAIEKDRMLQFRGEELGDREGETVGRLDEIYLDAESGEPAWALVTTGLFGAKRTFIPLAGATESNGQLRAAVEKGTLQDAPHVEPGAQLTEDEEAALFRHYGLEQPGKG
jgi:hypothetical protein